MLVRYDGHTIGNIITDQSMTVWQALDLIGVDPTEMDGRDPRYDLEKFDLRYDGVEILGVDTMPRQDTESGEPGRATVSVLKLDPGTRSVWIEQENARESYILADEYYNVTLRHKLDGRPDEDAAYDYLDSDDGQDLLVTVCDGWSRWYDGSNHIGHLTDNAMEAWEQIIEDLEALPQSPWELWPVEDWLDDYALDKISVTTTDAELERMAADAETNAETEHIVLSDDALEYLVDRRESLLDAMDDLITIDQAVDLAFTEYGKLLFARSVRYDAKHGLIDGAHRFGRYWVFEQGAFLYYLFNKLPRASRKD